MDVSIEFTSMYKSPTKLLSQPSDLPSGQDHPPAAAAKQQLAVPTHVTISTNKYSQHPSINPSPTHPSVAASPHCPCPAPGFPSFVASPHPSPFPVHPSVAASLCPAHPSVAASPCPSPAHLCPCPVVASPTHPSFVASPCTLSASTHMSEYLEKNYQKNVSTAKYDDKWSSTYENNTEWRIQKQVDDLTEFLCVLSGNDPNYGAFLLNTVIRHNKELRISFNKIERSEENIIVERIKTFASDTLGKCTQKEEKEALNAILAACTSEIKKDAISKRIQS
eukprot:14126797-Ditylum_brightwellii.AAC.1